MRAGVFMARDGFARLRRRIAEIEGRSADFVQLSSSLTEGTSADGLPPHPSGLGVSAAFGDLRRQGRKPSPTKGEENPAEARRRGHKLGPPLPWWERPAPDPDPGAVSLGEPEANLEKRGEAARLQRMSLLPFGIPKLDRILGGGLRRAALHEIRSGESRDAAAATGFAVGVLAILASQEARSGAAATGKHQEARSEQRERPGSQQEARRTEGPTGKQIMWIIESAAAHEAGFPYAAGLRCFGLSPSRLIVVRVRKPGDVLWVFEEGLRCRGLAAVVAEIRGNPRPLDLTASRRLALRAGAHGVMGLLLRQTSRVEPNAAATRWLVAPRPAATTDDYPDGIGNPVWRLTLERNRSGATGVFDVEWDHERGTFAESAPARAAHSLPVAAVSADRPPPPADIGQCVALDRAS